MYQQLTMIPFHTVVVLLKETLTLQVLNSKHGMIHYVQQQEQGENVQQLKASELML